MKLRAIAQVISSWWTLACLLVLFWASYLAFTFGQDAYARWVRFLLHTPAGLTLYLGLVMNLLAATARVVIRNMLHEVPSPETVRAMDVWTEMPRGKATAADIAAWMKSKDLKPFVKDNTVTSQTGYWSFVPGTVTRLGLAGFMISLLVSVHVRQTSTAIMHKGEAAEFFGESVMLQEIDAVLTDDFLQVGEQSSFVLDDVQLKISTPGKGFEISPGMPARRNGLYYRVAHLGYSQPMTVRAQGRAISVLADLDILPPGKTHIVPLPGTSLFLTAALEPVRTISKGLLKGKQYDLKDPLYRVLFQSGAVRNKPVALLVRPGENSSGAGVTVSAGKNGLYARIVVVKDPALFCVYAALMLIGIGLVLMTARFFWYRKGLAAVLSGDTIVIGWNEEFFKKWGIERFYSWKEELAELPQQ